MSQERRFEQPENYVARTAEEEQARKMVVDVRESFIRELTQSQIADVKRILPATIFQQWVNKKKFVTKSAVQRKVELLKIRKKLKTILSGMVCKALGKMRFRPGNTNSTLKRLMTQRQKLKERYLKTGGGNSGWTDMEESVKREFGSS